MTRTNKLKQADEDWFKTLDKNYENVHFKYKNLDKKKIGIAKETYVLSLIEYSNDKKKFNIIKEQMNKQESIEEYKLKNKKTEKQKDFIFPNLNILNYKTYKPQTSYISNVENEAITVLLGKLDKKNKRKIRNQFIHRKVIPQDFYLSKSNFANYTNYNNTISTDVENHKNKSSRQYHRPNIYYKYSLNNNLYKVLQDISKEENLLLKTSNNLINDLNKKNLKSKPQNIQVNKFNKRIYGNYQSVPFIDKMYFKGKKNFFDSAKEKMYNFYVKKMNNPKNKEMKLVSSRRNSEEFED